MVGPTDQLPISIDEADALFGDLTTSPGLLLAVSGGPDSTALLWLAARWHKKLKGKTKPKLIAATVDHGLRKESAREAAAVGKLAKQLGVAHRILKWTGAKPKSGIQQSARQARYGLLARAAKAAGATHILTAHTLDDQAETVLMRMARGSGLGGLGGMGRRSRLDGLTLVRPFLDLPKTRLVATLQAAKVTYVEDPSNADPRFTRARLRPLMPKLAQEGLDARRFSILSRRLRRAEAAIEADVDRVMATLAAHGEAAITLSAAHFARLPAEIALRLLGRMVASHGDEGPVELGKLEALLAAAMPAAQKPAKAPFRRTLAGALISIAGGEIRVARAPARRQKSVGRVLTKRRSAPPRRKKTR
jgi:tRNA(Ile)-lysidine synthase